MTTHEIRQAFFDFYVARSHAVIPSSSLLPENDPTTLFVGSGMQPLIPYLLGEPHPRGNRLVNSQKCFRSQDIDEVGDNRHMTFFEMLGNWSLGDYFKAEQIPWVFEFVTKSLGLDPNRLAVSVFAGNDELGIARDNESAEIWKTVFNKAGVSSSDHIFYYDESKNWWSRSGVPAHMPNGEPGGPDSEIFWDFGEHHGFHDAPSFADQSCHINCDCGRYLEIGNSVFMQYKKTDNGFCPLPNENVDFGGGLERITAAVLDTPDVFLIDVFAKARETIETLSGKTYKGNENSFRVIMDHLRAATFLIGDGACPSNKDQGYFTRRLIRRAVRFAKNIGIDDSFASRIGESVIETYSDAYSSLETNRESIKHELEQEEKKFRDTLSKGEREFEKMYEKKNGISGKDAFVLYSTYGFPLELTEEMAKEKGQITDRETFKEEFEKHKNISRAGATQKFTGGLADHSKATVRLHTATHMLHQALRSVLGDHVFQKGSNITNERLRFDFSHSDKMTDEQKKSVEDLVNQNIQKAMPVHFEILDIDTAKKHGAIGVFDDKYALLGGKIKVYFIGDQATGEYYSREVCGGPHVENTSELGHFTITKEESVSSGIRRIKATLT